MRIGQGIEFDYCAVQAADVLRRQGIAAVMINSNPETVSTDFDASTRLYFEPLDGESVLEVIAAESADGSPPMPALVAFGGQTPLGLARALEAAGVPMPGLEMAIIERAKESTRFAAMVEQLGIPQPEAAWPRPSRRRWVVAERIGYPVLVRPSYVIGDLAIDTSYGQDDLARQLAAAAIVSDDRPVRIDAYLEGMEVDVDAVSDGREVLIPGLIEHVEAAGVHSGDSIGVFPPQRISAGDQDLIVTAMTRVALAVGARGLVSAQFIVRDDGVYLIEVNPRQPDGAVPLQGDRRAHGGAGHARCAGRVAGGAGLVRRVGGTARDRGRQGARLLDGQADRRGSGLGTAHAVDRRGHRHP